MRRSAFNLATPRSPHPRKKPPLKLAQSGAVGRKVQDSELCIYRCIHCGFCGGGNNDLVMVNNEGYSNVLFLRIYNDGLVMVNNRG